MVTKTSELGIESVKRRINTKQQIIEELAAGRLDLRGAASRFRNLNAANGNYMPMMHFKYPGRSDDECICLNVIEYASAELDARADGPTLLATLRSEFEQISHR